MEIIEIKKDQQQYISEIAALESDIFPDPWSEKSIRDTLENPQAPALQQRRSMQASHNSLAM